MRKLILLLACLPAFAVCHAGTLTIDHNPVDFSNMQATIDGANDGGVFEVLAGGCAGESADVGAAGTDYSDTWFLTPPVMYSCAFGMVDILFDRVVVVDSEPNIAFEADTACCTMTGTLGGDGGFTAVCSCPGACTVTFAITGSFTSAGTFSATQTVEFSGGSCFACVKQSWTVSGERPVGCIVDFRHYARFALHWLEMPCDADNDWCGGADLDQLGEVNAADLGLLADVWLDSCPSGWLLE